MAQGNTDHFKVQYKDAVTHLAGFLRKSMLYDIMEKDSKKGEVVFLDSFAPNDEADSTALTSADYYRKDYEDIGSPTLADWTRIQTPHKEVTRARTLLTPLHNETGHTFRSTDEVAINGNENSRVLKELMGTMKKKRDQIILNALFAHNVSRGKDSAAAANVAFPTDQEVPVADGILDKEVINEVKTKFENNYIDDDEKIYMIISPDQKQNLIDNSGNTIHNRDFVTPEQYFQKGTLPDIYGCHLIVHPLLKVGRGYEVDGDGNGSWSAGRACAFTSKWGCFNQFDALTTEMDKAPTQRFQMILYLNEMINAARVDDKRVVHIQFGTQAP